MNSSDLNSTASTSSQNRPVLWRSYLAFLVPMIISNMLQALSGTVNNIYLGQMLGVNAMAAVSAFFPVLFLLISFMIGLGIGASVLIGQAWGAKEYDRVKAIAGTTLSVGICFGVFIALFGGAFTEPLLRSLATPADILPQAVNYARIMLFAAPVLFVYLLTTSMLRGVGDTKTPLKTLLLSTAISLLLTPALIRGWWGLPQLGITAGAYAAAVSFTVAMAWTAWFLRRKHHPQFAQLKHGRHPLAPDMSLLKHMRINFNLLKLVLIIGLPSAVSIISMALAEIAVLFLVNRFGSQATAAFGAVQQIVNFVQFPAISIAITASILGAQAIGAGRTHYLGKIARTGIYLNLVLTGALVLLGTVFARPIIGLFITDNQVIDVAQSLLHIMLWGNVIMGMSMVLSGLMRASGDVVYPTIFSLIAIVGVLVPSAWYLSTLYGLPGVWAGFPIAFSAMLVMQTTYYLLVWRKKPIKRL